MYIIYDCLVIYFYSEYFIPQYEAFNKINFVIEFNSMHINKKLFWK